MNIHVITIDGPSGSGKGTLATKIAQHYRYHLLDSGALYRLLGLSLQRQNLITKIHENLIDCVNIAHHLQIEFLPTSQGIQVVLDGEDVSQVIRTEEVGAFASKVAVVPELRAALLQRQRDFAQTPGLVADGRDMGTVVFPHSQAKLYLTATAQSRAERRAKQLQSMGEDAKIADILANIQARDKRDMEREVAPLKPAVDALVIDSSYLTIDEVFMQMVNYIDVQLAKTL